MISYALIYDVATYDIVCLTYDVLCNMSYDVACSTYDVVYYKSYATSYIVGNTSYVLVFISHMISHTISYTTFLLI